MSSVGANTFTLKKSASCCVAACLSAQDRKAGELLGIASLMADGLQEEGHPNGWTCLPNAQIHIDAVQECE
jgi:hypothetical protein